MVPKINNYWLKYVKKGEPFQTMAVRIKSQKISKGLDGDDGAGDGIIFGNRLQKKDLRSLSSERNARVQVRREGCLVRRSEVPRLNYEIFGKFHVVA